MAANTVAKTLHDQSGQSILEVVLVLPFLFLFVGILFKLNMGIQQAINNTQFARSQIYVLTSNSPEYPRLQWSRYSASTGGQKVFSENGQDMMVLGVSDPSAIGASGPGGIDPIPQIQNIARNKTVKGSEDSGEVTKRADVRIRNTAAICTQLNVLPTGTSQRWPFAGPVCQYKGMDGG